MQGDGTTRLWVATLPAAPPRSSSTAIHVINSPLTALSIPPTAFVVPITFAPGLAFHMAENAGSSARQPPGSDSGTSDPKPARGPARVREHGLTELWAGGSDPVADVVFVHGLQGHPYKTWLFEGRVEEQVWV